MADISKITALDNTTYNIKDSVARGYNTTIAPVEASTTAAVEHPLGSIFYINNVLYRALDDISVGDTIIIGAGGNATQTTVAQNFKRVVTLTSQEYSQLSDAEKDADIVYIITDDNSIAANNVSYDPTTSGMTATNVQNAVNELAANKASAGYGLGVMMRDVGTSVTDCNNVNVTGWFDVSTTAANRPSGVTNTNACLYSVVRGPQFAYQEFYFYDGTNQRVFCRFRNTVNTPQWTSWKEIAYANKSLATEQQLAYVESGTTASRAYAVGENFCWNGLLYRVTAAISSGGTFTPGTNCETTTVMSAITANWTPVNATTPYANRNYFFKFGKFMLIAVCIQLSSDLNAGQEREILSSVLSTCGAQVNPNQLTTNTGIAFLSSSNDIPIRIIYTGGKLYVRNQSGTTVDTSRIIYGQIVLGIQ